MGDDTSKSATLYALDLFREFEDWGGIRPPDEIAAWDPLSDLVCSKISALPLDNNYPNYTNTLGAPTPCKPTAPLCIIPCSGPIHLAYSLVQYFSSAYLLSPSLCLHWGCLSHFYVYLPSAYSFRNPFSYAIHPCNLNSVYTLNSGSYLSHLPPPYVPLSNMYILSLQVHISQISHRRVRPCQLCIYPHFKCISPTSPTAVCTPISCVSFLLVSILLLCVRIFTYKSLQES